MRRTSQHQKTHTLGPTIALSGFLAIANPAMAINKCVDAKGKVIYQEAPCPTTHETKPVNTSGAGKADPTSSGTQYWERQIGEMKRQEAVDAAVLNREVFIGMTAEEVVRSWGKPTKINTTATRHTRLEQWVYRRSNRIGGPTQYVYLENGRVRSLQDN